MSSCGLFEIHCPLSSPVIPFSPSLFPSFHPIPVPCQICRILKGNITVTKGLSSAPRLIPYVVYKEERRDCGASILQKDDIGNSPHTHTHSLSPPQFPIPKMSSACYNQQFLLPGFNRASSHTFFISSTVFQEQQDSEI